MSNDHPLTAAECADDALTDRLIQRWVMSAGEPAGFAPAREAATLRRMISRAGGVMPAEAVERLWRTLAAEWRRFDAPLQVLLAGGEATAMIEGARGLFGFHASLLLVGDVREALERVEHGQSSVLAFLPWPELTGAGQWWPMLNEQRFRDLTIGCGWPLSPAVSEPARMAVVGRIALQASGHDETLAVAIDDAHAAAGQLVAAGIPAEAVARARSFALLKLQGFVGPDDPRLDTARAAGLEGLRIIGARPRL